MAQTLDIARAREGKMADIVIPDAGPALHHSRSGPDRIDIGPVAENLLVVGMRTKEA